MTSNKLLNHNQHERFKRCVQGVSIQRGAGEDHQLVQNMVIVQSTCQLLLMIISSDAVSEITNIHDDIGYTKILITACYYNSKYIKNLGLVYT